MKPIYLLLVFSLLFMINSQSQTTLCEEIKSMADKDQRARHNFHQAKFDTVIIMTDSTNAFLVSKIREMDSINFFREKEIINEFGFIDTIRFGKDCSYNFWLLMQHADKHIGLQKQYLSLFKKNLHKGIKKNYAYLTDRVMVNSGKKQLYGTQVNVIESNGIKTVEIKPTKNPKKLNKRRNSVDLKPIENYIEQFSMILNGTIIFEKED